MGLVHVWLRGWRGGQWLVWHSEATVAEAEAVWTGINCQLAAQKAEDRRLPRMHGSPCWLTALGISAMNARWQTPLALTVASAAPQIRVLLIGRLPLFMQRRRCRHHHRHRRPLIPNLNIVPLGDAHGSPPQNDPTHKHTHTHSKFLGSHMNLNGFASQLVCSGGGGAPASRLQYAYMQRTCSSNVTFHYVSVTNLICPYASANQNTPRHSTLVSHREITKNKKKTILAVLINVCNFLNFFEMSKVFNLKAYNINNSHEQCFRLKVILLVVLQFLVVFQSNWRCV